MISPWNVTLTVLLLVLSLLRIPGLNRHPLIRRYNELVGSIACRPALAIAVVGLVSIAVNILVAVVVRPPLPHVHDEFAYLLGGETFASGRLTNPTHELSDHFVTYHIIQTPSYQSKYPPAQLVTLAAGEALFGSPIVGVWLTFGLACGLTTWMLQAWVSPRWALWGGMAFALNPLLVQAWGQTYWGGGVALAGGALLFGGMRRVIAKPHPWSAILLSLGVVILANSRPLEGGIVALACALVLLGWMFRIGTAGLTQVVPKVVLPTIVVLALGGTGMYIYNKAVTGNGLKMPYQVWLEQRGTAITGTLTGTLRDHEQEHQIYPANPGDPRVIESLQQEFAQRVQQRQTWAAVETKLVSQFAVYVGVMLLPGLLVLPWMLRSRWRLFAFVVSLVVLAAISMNAAGGFSHYTAPAAPLFLYLVIEGLRGLQAFHIGNWYPGRTYTMLLGPGLLLLILCDIPYWYSDGAVRAGDWSRSRARLQQQLVEQPGDDVVLVRYLLGHRFDREWVYNGANIDSQPVIWARDLGLEKNMDLVKYYPDRNIWMLVVGESSVESIPYQDFLAEQVLQNEVP